MIYDIFSFFTRKVRKKKSLYIAWDAYLDLDVHPTFRVLASDCKEEEVHLNIGDVYCHRKFRPQRRSTLKIALLGSALKKEADETLFLELALRSQQDTTEFAEIVKIA